MSKTIDDITPEEWDNLNDSARAFMEHWPHVTLEEWDDALEKVSDEDETPFPEWDMSKEQYRKLMEDTSGVEKGIKHDAGKLPMDLIAPEAERMEAEVLAHGLKYGSHNWRGGLKYSRLIASLMRHFNAWRSGVDVDEESGLSHMAHVRAISGFLCTFVAEERHELDDRYRREVK